MTSKVGDAHSTETREDSASLSTCDFPSADVTKRCDSPGLTSQGSNTLSAELKEELVMEA